MKPLIIYHRDTDGFCAAWVTWRALGKNAELLSAQYKEAPPSMDRIRDRRIFVVDFSYPREVLEAIHKEAAELVVLDHHASAEKELADLPYCFFDKERSGAGMAWDYFHPGEARPWVVNYVEDRDLWRFALAASDAINAWIYTLELDLEVWERSFGGVEWDEAEPREWFRSAGRAILAFKAKQVTAAVRSAAAGVYIDEEGYGRTVRIVNVATNTSEVLGTLAKEVPEAFTVGWRMRKDGHYHYELRSAKETGMDVSEVAKRHGGGGHKHAAGFISIHGPLAFFEFPIGGKVG